MEHMVNVYRRTGSDGGCARGDCSCGWTTGKLESRDFAYVKRETERHELTMWRFTAAGKAAMARRDAMQKTGRYQ